MGHGHHHFAAHDLPFVMGIGIVFSGAIVVVPLGRRIERGELLQPLFVVVVQSRFIIVDEDTGGNVHGVAQAQSFLDVALAHASSTAGVMFTKSMRAGTCMVMCWCTTSSSSSCIEAAVSPDYSPIMVTTTSRLRGLLSHSK